VGGGAQCVVSWALVLRRCALRGGTLTVWLAVLVAVGFSTACWGLLVPGGCGRAGGCWCGWWVDTLLGPEGSRAGPPCVGGGGWLLVVVVRAVCSAYSFVVSGGRGLVGGVLFVG